MNTIAGTQLTAGYEAPSGPDWLVELSRDGLETFAATGLPLDRVESWRYTDLSSVARQDWAPAGAGALRLDALPEAVDAATPGPRIVLFQGRVQPHLSDMTGLAPGVEWTGLAAAPLWAKDYLGRLARGEAMPLAALNTAYIHDGAVLRVPAGVKLAAPVHIVSVGGQDGAATVFHPRILVVAGADSEATLIEHHLALGEGDYFSNCVTEFYVQPGARLTHTKIQDEAVGATHLAATHVDLASRARYRGFILQKGGALARHEVDITLGEGADCRIAGAYLAADGQHLDTTIRVTHAAPGAVSRQHVKGVLAGRSQGVFQGKITVARGAQQTDGQQMSRALLLSREARVSVKPELEIYADDVKCGHGATSGALDEAALFYLTARGIDRATARALLIGAFIEEVLAEIEDPASLAAVRAPVDAWLAGQTGQTASVEAAA